MNCMKKKIKTINHEAHEDHEERKQKGFLMIFYHY
jgi:hypothetical protein